MLLPGNSLLFAWQLLPDFLRVSKIGLICMNEMDHVSSRLDDGHLPLLHHKEHWVFLPIEPLPPARLSGLLNFSLGKEPCCTLQENNRIGKLPLITA